MNPLLGHLSELQENVRDSANWTEPARKGRE